MNGFFLAYLILLAMSVGINVAKHGEPREDNYNMWSAFIGAGINITIVYFAIKYGL